MLEQLKALRAKAKADAEALLSTVTGESRGLTEAENAQLDTYEAEIRRLDGRIEAAQQDALAEARAAQLAVETGDVGEQRARDTGHAHVTDPPVYVRDGRNGVSYLQDLANASLRGSHDARERLARHATAREVELRALNNTNTAGGSGGEFAPPAWLIDDFVAYIRPGRAVADLYVPNPVPAGVSSVNIPKITLGTQTALQTSQNTTVNQRDMTTGSVSTGFSTIAGKEVVSRQLLDQTAINFDQVVIRDLAADYGFQLGNQVVNGTGTGANNNAVVNGLASYVVPAALAVTIATVPTPAQFWSKCAGLISSFVTTRYLPPTHWIMHPRRFYWLLAQTDSQGRPLLVPQGAGTAFNSMGEVASTTLQAGAAGQTGLVFLGVPVVVDPNIPTNLGTGTNQDEVFLARADDLYLYESPYEQATFEQPYAESLGILFRIHGYLGAILNRVQNGSVATLNGAGLVAPTF